MTDLKTKAHFVTADGKPMAIQDGHVLVFDLEARLKIFTQTPTDFNDTRFQLLPKCFRTQSEGSLLHGMRELGLEVTPENRRKVLGFYIGMPALIGLDLNMDDVGGEELEQNYAVRIQRVAPFDPCYFQIRKTDGEMTVYDKNPLEESGPKNSFPNYSPFQKGRVLSPDELSYWLYQMYDLLMLNGPQEIRCISDSPTDGYFAVGC